MIGKIMKTIRVLLLFGVGLMLSCHQLFAQTATLGGFNTDTAQVQATPPDSIVQVTAEAQGLSLLPADQAPPIGTFWWVLPSGAYVPMPCPPLDMIAPIYQIAPGQFLADDTGGQVLFNPRRAAGLLARNAGSASQQALEAMANTVINLIQEVQTVAATPVVASPMLRSRTMTASSLATSFAYGNAVYLYNMTASIAGDGSTTASFSIGGGTNFVPYDILTTTNVAAPVASWNWLGIGYTSNRYTFAKQPSGYAFYILAKPSKTMVVGWGEDKDLQTDVPAGITNAVMVAGGYYQGLALLNDGTIRSWGDSYFTSQPTNLTGVSMIACGWNHNVALLTNGTVKAWGFSGNPFGWRLTAVPTNLNNVTVISAQSCHTLALTSNGTVVAWGYGVNGETNIPAGLSNVVAIAAGGVHNLAVSNGYVVAWGYNGFGQCNVPTNLNNVFDVAAGWMHSVALKKDGTVVCWGDDNAGECDVPAGLTNVVAIAAGGFGNRSGYTLALKGDGTMSIWGSGKAALPVNGLNQIISIAGGAEHALALRTGTATPFITQEPTDQYQIQGSNAVFNAKGQGLYGVTYQWQLGSVNIAGATNLSLIVSNVQTANIGIYDVVVTDNGGMGSLVSSNAYLEFVTGPEILSQTPMPTNQTVIYQTNVTLSVEAWAAGYTNGFPLGYQWSFNGNNIAAITKSLNFKAVVGAAGTYSVRVSNAVGSTNRAWQLAVVTTNGINIAQQPTNQYQIAGGNVSFAVMAISSNTLTYQWLFNGTNLSGAMGSSLTLTNVQTAQQGNYTVVISDGVNLLNSSNAYFYLVTPPIIASQTPMPTNQVAPYQTNLILSATATAPGMTNGFPLYYRWQFNGTNLPGANSNSLTRFVDTPTLGTYSVVVTNAAGNVTSQVWQVTMTYLGSYISPGTLAYHLSTNAVAHTNGIANINEGIAILSNWSWTQNTGTNLIFITNSVWSTNFWLKSAQGLSATAIGLSNYYGAQLLVTMISPRHCLYANHAHLPPGRFIAAFLDTNNSVFWRTNVENIFVGNDTSVGILDSDLPPSVGYLPVLPSNYTNYLPANNLSSIQGIGMNQQMTLFGQPMTLGTPFINWSPTNTAPFGLTTNWNVLIVGGDSSDPEMLLIGNQLVLASHNFHSTDGPNYASQINLINQDMHYLSTNNGVGTDYQITPFSMTNWPTIQ